MNTAFHRFHHPQKQGFQGGDLSDDHWSPDEAARWALRRAREERARKVRVRGFWWIAAAIVFAAFILAADQGFAEAQFKLGIMYAEGRGVLKDEAEAVRWYRLAADQGLAGAQGDLGIMYASGTPCLRTCGSTSLVQMGTQAPESIGTFLSVT